jgi:c(7)-type cytochrome triheme protein
MRAFALLVALVALAGIGDADGFDHARHDRAAGADKIACAQCHELDKTGRLAGKPGHAMCFGACHGAPPKSPAIGTRLVLDDDRRAVCASCHADPVLAAPFTGRMPIANGPTRDFDVAFGHKRHASTACAQCHDVSSGAARPQPHARCVGCHDGAKAPPMTACSGCHLVAATPKPSSLGAIFSHPRHAGRSQAGRECATCHAAIALDDAVAPARPTVAECARCHDGTQAFATTVACTRCHAAPTERFEVARPEARFSHAGPHAQLVAAKPCSACHALAKNGDALAPGHTACVDVGCHATDFGAREPTKCGACHLATEPWRHLRADRPPPDATEFGATLDHAKHPGDCARCHALRTKAAELQMPRGHAACAGVACHSPASTSGGPAPRLDDCAGCHALGRAVARVAERAADPWSVRPAFSHASHQLGACTSCHADLTGADVVKLAVPTKPTCAPCHDGAAAFSLTGTTCRKCHRP